MASPALQVHGVSAGRWRVLAFASLVALSTSGCLNRPSNEVTGSIATNSPAVGSQDEWRRYAETWGARFEANPADPQAAMNYARALRATEQRTQAVAVLQQAAIRNPKSLDLLAAYGKALAEAGRLKEAHEVLGRAHTPERPDWRILSAQGAVADQLGEHAVAQRYYEAALKIAAGEPTVLSNLGLSYALSKRLPEAEQALKQAADHPRADIRVRQNLALVLGLQGKFQDAEQALKRDLAAPEATANVTVLRRMVTQPNSWSAIRRADKKTVRSSEAGQDPKS
jgi:Flp pilus assembly protein TadD